MPVYVCECMCLDSLCFEHAMVHNFKITLVKNLISLDTCAGRFFHLFVQQINLVNVFWGACIHFSPCAIDEFRVLL